MFSQKIREIFSYRALLATIITAAGWGWYHLYKHPKWVFVGKMFFLWLVIALIWMVGKKVVRHFLPKLPINAFWKTTFFDSLDSLFFLASFVFGIYFSRSEVFSLVYSFILFYCLFRYVQSRFALHPEALGLLKINRAFFSLAGFIFIFQSLAQFAAYHYYILDSNIRFYNIVFFRVFALTLVSVALMGVAGAFFSVTKKWWRQLGFVVWGALFILWAVFWVVNVGILYFSGLYVSPVALGHAEGAGRILINNTSVLLFGILLVLLTIGMWFVRRMMRVCSQVPRRFVFGYAVVFSVLGLGVVFGLASFRNTPEFITLSSFGQFYLGKTENVRLDPVVNEKLSRFGLRYEPDAFYVNSRPEVYHPTSTVLMPDRLRKNRPNVVMVFVESFSARFSGVYNPKLQGVTPNFDAFASDPHTTVFKNYFNASTPTITGTLSQLCSFLPPTGHNEIQNERKLQNHHLLCLPEVLKKHAGFKYANYITAVDKEYANKDGIFRSMGIDDVYGTSELAKFIPGEPLSWGYSDHQLFPQLFTFMQQAPQPFFMSLATVDTHPPFNLPKDAINYGDGSQSVLNMFHTTDDAFGGFWKEFKKSAFYSNTILVVVADHAIFPGAVTTDIFPEDGGKMTYYDPNYFALYVPDSVLPKNIDMYSSGIDMMPTLLQMLTINIPNSFEGHSLFDDRRSFPNILGMHELELYTNEAGKGGKRFFSFADPNVLDCAGYSPSSTTAFTMCDYLHFYRWKRQMFQEGRFWKH